MQVRVKGRRHGKVCGPDEVHLVTTARGEPLVGTPTGGPITKLRHPPAGIPASDIHGLRHSRRVAAGVPPVDPHVILYVGKRMPRSLLGTGP